MTDLMEPTELKLSERPIEDELSFPAPEPPQPKKTSAALRPLPMLLTLLLSASAVLFFAMASGHLHGWKATAAIVAALVQATLAVLVMTKASTPVMASTAVVNVPVGALWFVLQGGHSLSTATAGVGLALSVLAIALAAGLALRPSAGTRWASQTLVFGSVVPVAVVAVTVTALFSTPSTAPAPIARPTSAPGGAAAAAALGSTVQVPGENSKTFQSVIAGNETEQSELQKWVPLDPATQALLSQQLAQAYQAAMRYPTVADAKAAKMILAGGMAPGVGAHYQVINGNIFKGINPDGSINPSYPASWIYASTADNAPVVGVMYESMGQSAPSGFAGPNDHWHQHSNVCVQYNNGEIGVPFAADQDVTPQECADVHGTFMKKTIWMVHAWVVPGWESPQGVFSHDNLHVYCPGNTDITDAIGFCVRQQ